MKFYVLKLFHQTLVLLRERKLKRKLSYSEMDLKEKGDVEVKGEVEEEEAAAALPPRKVGFLEPLPWMTPFRPAPSGSSGSGGRAATQGSRKRSKSNKIQRAASSTPRTLPSLSEKAAVELRGGALQEQQPPQALQPQSAPSPQGE